jgi:hypothetical protein
VTAVDTVEVADDDDRGADPVRDFVERAPDLHG